MITLDFFSIRYRNITRDFVNDEYKIHISIVKYRNAKLVYEHVCNSKEAYHLFLYNLLCHNNFLPVK